MNDSILNQDINHFCSTFDFETKNRLLNKHICITGATGLIGSTLVKCLLALNGNISITIPVRNKKKAITLFGRESANIHIVECDLLEWIELTTIHFDYIIHCASPTSGKFMLEHPVETYEFIIESTRALLRYACKYKIEGFLYVSSLEYYGQNFDDQIITEEKIGFISSAEPRSCYPLGKRSAEFLCTAYAVEYGIPVKIARLTQTFGPGVSKDDNRVFAQFARSIIENEDIVLHTTGDSAKPYCYTIDGVSAILYVLIKGNRGESYNVANEETYMSIRDLAWFLRDNFNPRINVKIEKRNNMGYAPVTKLRLSSKKLMQLGWKPLYNMKTMLSRLLQSMEEQEF